MSGLSRPAQAPAWCRRGPYASDRQWGTFGAAWDHLPHDHARSRAYRWGEDAIGGYSDEGQHWCLGVALCANDGTARERLRVLRSINDRQPRMLY